MQDTAAQRPLSWQVPSPGVVGEQGCAGGFVILTETETTSAPLPPSSSKRYQAVATPPPALFFGMRPYISPSRCEITRALALRLGRFVRGLPPTPAICGSESLAPSPCGSGASFVGYRPHPQYAAVFAQRPLSWQITSPGVVGAHGGAGGFVILTETETTSTTMPPSSSKRFQAVATPPPALFFGWRPIIRAKTTLRRLTAAPL